jgi:hypothetical protein
MSSNVIILNWHPMAEAFPAPEGEEREALKQSLKASNGNRHPILYRVVEGRIQGLAGKTRYVLCRELRIQPNCKKVHVSDEDVEQFIIDDNLRRRHMTKEARQEIVARLRAMGRSTRQIGDAMGTSKSTVERDLQSTVPSGTLETVVGKDGKQQAAKVDPIIPELREMIDGGTITVKLADRITDLGKTLQRDMLGYIQVQHLNPREALKTAESSIGHEPGEDRPTRRKPSTNGRAYPTWRESQKVVGALIREVDRVAKAYGVMDTPLVHGLHRQLKEWFEDFEKWHRGLKPQKDVPADRLRPAQ